jgi:hypothetical protein
MGTAQAERRAGKATASRASATAATPWGVAVVLEEVAVQQRVGEKRFAVAVQLLETKESERLVRFAYTTPGSGGRAAARRGPVTMRARDLERLRAALEAAPVLREVLGF